MNLPVMSELPFRDELRRKLVHLSSFWIPALMLLCGDHNWTLTLLFGLLTVGSLLVEHSYAMGNPLVIRLYNACFSNMLREKPTPGLWVISGGPYVLAAACLALFCFPPSLAAASMALMLAGDTAAALIGKRFGRVRFPNRKSLEGSLAFLVAGSLAFALFFHLGGHPLGKSLILASIAAVAGCLAEFFEKQLHIDDNIAITLFSGAAVLLIQWIIPSL